jgi:hypothetical protein
MFEDRRSLERQGSFRLGGAAEALRVRRWLWLIAVQIVRTGTGNQDATLSLGYSKPSRSIAHCLAVTNRVQYCMRRALARQPGNYTSPRKAFFRACMAVLICVVLGGCEPGVEGRYQPPFVPIEISVDQDGDIEVRQGFELITYWGTFGLGGKIESPEDGKTLLVIAHQDHGTIAEDVYEIDTDEKLHACLNGAF